MTKEKNIQTVNPATGEILETYNYLTDKELEEAIDNCHRAFKKWKLESIENRAKIINAIGKKLQEHQEELSRLMTSEMGKPLTQSHDEVYLCSGICEYSAKIAPKEFKNEEFF